MADGPTTRNGGGGDGITVDVVVVGGGLAGLTAADALLAAAPDATVMVLESRGRVGGRAHVVDAGAAPFDLGAAWVWTTQNPTIMALLDRLGLDVFPTTQLYDSVYETNRAGVQRIPQRQYPLDSSGERRIVGGAYAVAAALRKSIARASGGRGSVQLNAHVHKLVHRASLGFVEVSYGDGPPTCDDGQAGPSEGSRLVTARCVVVCAPPRLVPEHIAFTPPLPLHLTAALGDTRTWMAQQAKAIIRYPHAFWEDDRLSGEARSERGPLEWITNASVGSAPDQLAALSGFLTHDPGFRGAAVDEQKAQIIDQLVRLFGPRACEGADVTLFDWAQEATTCAPRDRREPSPWRHPDYSRHHTILAAPQWAGALWFGGSETATQSPGFLDGAVAAGQARARDVLRSGVLSK